MAAVSGRAPRGARQAGWYRGANASSLHRDGAFRVWGARRRRRMERFEPVDPKVSFPELERRILEFWRERDVFAASLELREGRARSGSSTRARRRRTASPASTTSRRASFKDVYPRFKTMTGHLVPRKGGWDCHGLPVELEVEKEIGTTASATSRSSAIAEFNRLCRESVERYVDDFERLTERIGFWIDMSDAYWTMDTEYIESVWWSLKQLHERGLLVEADKVTAYCPRCGTALSDAEVALGYQTVEDPSVFVRFPVRGGDRSRRSSGRLLLVWTTTPWTLPSNTGRRRGRRADVRRGRARRRAADRRRGRSRETSARRRRSVVATRRGQRPGRRAYEPPYPNVEGAHAVVAGDFVSMDDGTGIVHMAPAFGAEDLAIGRRRAGRCSSRSTTPGGSTTWRRRSSAGASSRTPTRRSSRTSRERGLLLRAGDDRARVSVLLALRRRRSSTTRGVLVRPHHRGEGAAARGERRRQLVPRAHQARPVRQLAREQRRLGALARALLGHAAADLALRRRTPAPRSARSRSSGELAGRDVRDVDPHRPAIDEVTFACPECGGDARRASRR